MKKTLLEITQDILNDLDSDNVNDIDDTIESEQVASIIRASYFEMIANRNWPHLRKLVQLEASGDTSKPNYLKLPEGVKELSLFKYNKRKSTDTKDNWADVSYKEPDAFLRLTQSRNSGDTANIRSVIDYSGTTILVHKLSAPTYWTSFDDVYLVTDSYDSVLDTTLQTSKNQAMAYINPTWTHTNSFTPNLPIEAFPALIEEAKSTAFFAIKQMANQKAEQKANRQQRWLARKAWRAKGGVKYDDYGRKSRR